MNWRAMKPLAWQNMPPTWQSSVVKRSCTRICPGRSMRRCLYRRGCRMLSPPLANSSACAAKGTLYDMDDNCRSR